METPTLNCRSDQRRHTVRRFTASNGIDYLKISADRRTITVYLLRKASAALQQAFAQAHAKNHIVIEDGQLDRDVEVVSVRLCHEENSAAADYLLITVEPPDDLAAYTLRLAELDKDTKEPTPAPMAGIDSQYAQIKIRFAANKSTALNGFDYLEVGDDQRTLTVYLLQKAKPELAAELRQANAKRRLVFKGGRRILGSQLVVDRVDFPEIKDPQQDDRLVIKLKEPGDFSVYTLFIAALENGQPTDEPMEGFDPRYAQLQFSFKANCPSELDCKTPKICPPPQRTEPEINYLAKDYASFRRLMLDRLSQIMPAWKERHVPDFGITLVEILAYAGDYLSYYQDAVATEAYLNTARQRISVRRHARLVDYQMHEGCNARTWVSVKTNRDIAFPAKEIYFVTPVEIPVEGIPAKGKILFHDDLKKVPASTYQVFEPLAESAAASVYFYNAHNEIPFYTWGDHECCLPRGATKATLHDEWVSGTPLSAAPRPMASCAQQALQESTLPEPQRMLHLCAGDFLIFEEVIGPKTGNAADADPAHRHVVRLTRVEPAVDPLNEQPVLDIEWAEEDALPFPLCISAIGPAPVCEHLENLSVARGNVVFADHGRRLEPEPLGQVQLKNENLKCVREGRPEDAVLEPVPFRAKLKNGSLTFSEPLAPQLPVAKLLEQDLGKALPQITLQCSCLTSGEIVDTEWLPQLDLLRSHSVDRHFVVEMDNDRIAHLRFGDGQSGRQPEVGESFKAFYRVGNGVSGNIGADALSHVVRRENFRDDTLQLEPRNPLPAKGGVEAEPLAEVKLFAPTAFRKRLERAITPEDYAELAVRRQAPRVQKAASTLRWNGSWYEVRVAIDPFETPEAEDKLLQEILTDLQRFRRMGHDLEVERADFVPLDIRMEICVRPGHLRGHVKAELLNKFSSKVLPDGARGFFHPDNLTLGQSIRLSNLYAEAQRIPGVESVNITKFQRLFQEPQNEIDNGLLPINPLEIARLDNDPSLPENGRIEFIMRGGR